MQANISDCLRQLSRTKIDPLELVPRRNLVEKLIELVLVGAPPCPAHVAAYLDDMSLSLAGVDTSDLRVVVFGGGSGLSNVIGGDSRLSGWAADPFKGLKEVFPQTTSIVCVTDDGGSTGELLKDLPIIALGDIRHVLLSSIRQEKLKASYGLSSTEALETASILHTLFNYRFNRSPSSVKQLLENGVSLDGLPAKMAEGIAVLLESLFTDVRLLQLLERSHCLGNLLFAAAIYGQIDEGLQVPPVQLLQGINSLAELIGGDRSAVMPCTTTPAQLKVLYSNGVLVSGESKTSTIRRRNTAVNRVFVDFVSEPHVPEEVYAAIAAADIVVFAPGSLYTSIIPILQVPGIAEAVRKNSSALKILVANLWIQKGETDLVLDDHRRRFYVSDLISAYHRNIPGGVKRLFEQVMVLGLQDIPGNILQSYAVEDKVPIYLDRGKVWQMGFAPVEARIFSVKALKERKVQHDPVSLAKAIKTIWAARDHIPREVKADLEPAYRNTHLCRKDRMTLDMRMHFFDKKVAGWGLDRTTKLALDDIFWRHGDILLDHLDQVDGLQLLKATEWNRSLEWDSVYSFYDPDDRMIKILEETSKDPERFECAFLVALGQSLLGNYAARKELLPIERNGVQLGKVFQLTLMPKESRRCFFSETELARLLTLVRMNRCQNDENLYTRLISGTEGFTPPGMITGLLYVWYLDSHFASHIEYKMAISRVPMSNLVREQVRILNRRMSTIDFLREVVFRHNDPVYYEQLAT